MRRLFFTICFCLPLIVCCGNGTDTLSSAQIFSLEEREGVEQRIVMPPLPQKASFAGEEVPLQYFDVRESLLRELTTITHWHGSLMYIMQLAGRYRGIVEKVLEEEGLHPDFFYLCVA